MSRKKLEELIKLVEQSQISELEITKLFGRKVRIAKAITAQNPPVPNTPPHHGIAVEEKPTAVKPEAPVEPNVVIIRSPMVGTFYRAPAPDAAPYVEVGDSVKPGQVLCIIEAMKLMNEIESEVSGKIVEIKVKNEEPVEFGQELFLIEPI